MARHRVVRWLAAGAIALPAACTTGAQTAPSSTPESTFEAPAQSDYTLPLLPKVNCENDQLSIEADNATLLSVLSAVESCLGVQIRPPAGFRDERTFAHLGPGPAKRILDDLLRTLELNYVIVLSGPTGRKITGVVLTSRVADNAEDVAEHSGPAGISAQTTGARRLWLASQMTSGRPLTSQEQPDETTREPDGTPAMPASRGTPEAPGAAAQPTSIASPESPQSATEANANSGTTVNAGKDNLGSVASAGSATVAPTSLTPAAEQPPVGPTTAASAASDGKGASSVLGQQINMLQQLIEQRRKLNTQPPSVQDPQ